MDAGQTRASSASVEYTSSLSKVDVTAVSSSPCSSSSPEPDLGLGAQGRIRDKLGLGPRIRRAPEASPGVANLVHGPGS